MLRLSTALAALAVGAEAFVGISPVGCHVLPSGHTAQASRAIRAAQGVRAAAMGVSTASDTAKSKLLALLGEAGLGKGETEEQVKQIDSLVEELSTVGTQFSRDVADGDWALVLSRNSKGSPKLQVRCSPSR